MRSRSLLATILAAVALVPAADAASVAVARFDDLRYQLVDLDPQDGIAPVLEFASVNAFIPNTYMLVSTNDAAGGGLDTYEAPGAFESHQLEVGTPAVSSRTGITGNLVDGLSLYAEAHANALGGYAARTYLPSGGSGVFHLTPMTAVIVTGWASYETTTTLAPTQSYPFTPDRAYVRGNMSMSGLSPSGSSSGGGQSSSDGFFSDVTYHCLPECTGVSVQRTGIGVALSFVNASSESIAGNFRFEVEVSGFSAGALPPSAVPEPHAISLLASGSAPLLAALWMRRRKTAARGRAGEREATIR
ncbi:MAG: hypothetical protein U1F52_10015 [Burkholderiales bacterium]